MATVLIFLMTLGQVATDGKGDLNSDGQLDMQDFAILSETWSETDPNSTMALTSMATGWMAKTLTKGDPNQYTVLILTPETDDVADNFTQCLTTIKGNCDSMGLKYIHLNERDVQWSTIVYIFEKIPIRTMFYFGHGTPGFELPNGQWIFRTGISVWDGRTRTRAYSFLKHNNSALETLPDNWDTRAKSIWDLRLYNRRNSFTAFMIGCYTGFENLQGGKNDMAIAFGCDRDWNIGWRENSPRCYVGNYYSIFTGGIAGYLGEYADGLNEIFIKLGKTYHGSYMDLSTAITRATVEMTPRVQWLLWGDDYAIGGEEADDRDTLVWYPGDVNLSLVRLQ